MARRLVQFLMGKVARLDRDRQWDEISIVLTGDDEISSVHGQHLGDASVTDVISFCYGPAPGIGSGSSGEIVVNVEQAYRKGLELKTPARAAWGPSSELALYIAHGCDHLTGADDHDPAARAQMRRRELRWIREARAGGMLENLLVSS